MEYLTDILLLCILVQLLRINANITTVRRIVSFNGETILKIYGEAYRKVEDFYIDRFPDILESLWHPSKTNPTKSTSYVKGE